MSGGARTNNLCEAWNRGFRSLVGASHPTIWKALEHIRLDHHNVKTASSRKHVVNHLRSDYEKSPNNYKVDSSICARHTIMTIKHLYNGTEGHWTHHQMEVTLICYMCKYQINLFRNLDVCLFGAFDQPGISPDPLMRQHLGCYHEAIYIDQVVLR